MKLVIAIIRPEKLNDVLEALYRAEVTGLTISRVRGHGGETEQVETYRGMTVKVELHDKVRLEIGRCARFFPRARPAKLATAKSSWCRSRKSTEYGQGKRTAPPLLLSCRLFLLVDLGLDA